MFADQCVQFHLRNRGFNKQWFDKIKTVGEQLADERQIPSMGIPAFSVFAIYIVMTAQEEVDEIIQPDQLSFYFTQIAVPCFKKQLVKLVFHIFITFHVVVDSFHLLKKRDDLLGLFVSYNVLLGFVSTQSNPLKVFAWTLRIGEHQILILSVI